MPDDMGGVPDIVPPPIVSQSVIFWIGTGGSAANMDRQIELSAGGFDTPGPARTAGGGVQLTPGFFCALTQ